MWTNDPQINCKMCASYGVNLLIFAEAIKINIFTQKMGSWNLPGDAGSQLHRESFGGQK